MLLIMVTIGFQSCQNKKQDEISEKLKSIIENEISEDLGVESKAYIFFLQNAECKCSDETLNRIENFDTTKGELIVVVNKRDHFSIPQLDKMKGSIKFISINTLISYGFLQDKDILVELENDQLMYSTL